MSCRSLRLAVGFFMICCRVSLAQATDLAEPVTGVADAAVSLRTIDALAAEISPEIDGLLDDPVWRAGVWQGDFIQLKPTQGEPARARTRVAVAYDRRHIYVAFRCFNPTGRSANSMITRRDGNMDLDNAVTVYLDTFHSRRDCYYFSTNSLGIQVDGRIGEDGRSNDKSWDCAWRVASREDSAGWTAEMAIPVNEIRFPEEKSALWGVNFRRNYPDLLETSFWSETDKAWRVSQFGDLAGPADFRKRFTAALYPYLVAMDANTPGRERRTIYSSGGTEVIAGADLRFSLGATATGNLTYNPDFATVEADQEVINLTRYETFFPEKRIYFLEGAELFKNRINVFYTRRIGDIDYGIKTSGRAGKYNFAVLSARERSAGAHPVSQTSVFRLQRDVFGSSNIGLLAVDRSYSGGFNRALSTDATIYLPSHVKVTSQFVGSFPSGDDKFTKAWFLRAARETEQYHYHLRFTNIDPGFRDNVNKVGYIRDDDRRELDSDARYDWWIKDHGLEKVNFFTKNNIFWSHGGVLRSVRFTQFVGFTFSNKWFVGFSNNYLTELYDKRYHNHTVTPEVGYNLEQWNSYSLIYQRGRNFDSDIEMWVFRSQFKPSDRLDLAYRFRHLSLSPDLNGRSTVQHVVTMDYNFTPDLYLRLFLQSNSSNDRFYLYGLFGWRFAPPFGALYLAYTADRFDQLEQDLGLPQVYRPRDERVFFVKLTVPLGL
ncbi:MAG: DUF5916 domain-containing protein [Gemmatimonadota bacterium]|nr:DUF5916 domain-containing protein [Gemmatimonadota bacterium]